MKFKIIIASVIVLLGFIVINNFDFAFGNVAGAPTGATGSPGDGPSNTCARSGCHTGTAVTNQNNWITSNIPAAGYTPGQTYTITATATYAGRQRFGFEISPQDLSGNYIGTLAVTASTLTQITGTKYITHKSAGTSGSGSDTWSFNWTAPSAGTGAFTFYGAFNCANNNNSSSGDIIYTSTLPVNEAPTPGLDCGVASIVFPATTACDSVFAPIIKLGNFGTTTLTTCTINYFVDANTPSTFTWSGNLASQTSTIVTLPTLTVSVAGTHTFTATTSAPNSSTDVMTNNDSRTSTFNLVFAGSTLPFSEGFELAAFPPAGWVRNNPDGLTSWARNTAAHFTGTASMKMDNFNYSSVGAIDDMITPAINLSTDPAPVLTFQVAYRLYDNLSSDTLRIFISTDCQQTWTQIYNKYGTPLTTITPATSTTAFTPTATNWRQESINLLPYQTATAAYIKFENITAFENNLYIDDIYINGPAGINDPTSEITSLDLFPNPALDILNVNYQLKENVAVSMQVYDMEGKTVRAISESEKPEGRLTESVDVKDLPSGIYFMHITAGTTVITRKFVVTH